MQKIRTKTRITSKTTTQILVAVIAIAAFGLAAYGFFFISQQLKPTLTPFPSVVQVPPGEPIPKVMPKAKNQPVVKPTGGFSTAAMTKKTLYTAPGTLMYEFSVSPLQDPT